MIAVSNKYKQAVYAPTRKTSAKVRFEVLDNEAYSDNTSTVTNEALISRKMQLTNKIRTMSHRYATFERDYWKLDGSFHIPPKVDEGDSELGWWSGDICDENGVFNPYQVLEFNFTEEHNSMGLTITFDSMANEYAADFDIDVYRADGTLVLHEAVTNNGEPIYVLTKGMDNYGKIVLTIKKWAKPYRRCRVNEVDFGVIKEYEGDKLINLNLIEQMNVVGDTLPANEIKFTIDNSNREFNILNPEGFYRFLKERQEVSAQIGVEIAGGIFEYVDFMRYYLVDWQSDEGALTTTFTARNILELLGQKEYTKSASGTLYDYAEDMMIEAGIENYFIDEGLKEISTTGFKDKITFRKGLQCIGIAAKATVYQDRNGILNIRRFEILDEQTTFMVYTGSDMYCGMAYPVVDSGYDMKNISFDNVYSPPQIKLDKLIRSLTMVVYIGDTKQEITYFNTDVKEGTGLKLDNPLIQSEEHAADIAQWILKESNLRALYRVNWRQNPCIECGDVVLIEDSYKAKKQSRITKQEYQFAGYLNGRTETKGGV